MYSVVKFVGSLFAVKWFLMGVLLTGFVVSWGITTTSIADDSDSGVGVLQTFQQEGELTETQILAEQQGKHKILFLMGVSLIVTVLLTAGLGVSMVLFNKQVFVAHMVSAGVTVFLSLAHAVAAMVWFFPF